MSTTHDPDYVQALREMWERSAYDRGFISNPFAGDDVAMLGLKRTSALLEHLGNPHEAFPLLHVAGSKGKGSTCAFAASILTASGMRTGRYTSPHLHSFRERFAIDGEVITESAFARLWDLGLAAASAVESRAPELGKATAFEITTAMAFAYFALEGCTAAVIEVGLGGTLDATNVITPAASIITALDFEHTRVLGSTMTEIATNKAGIIKPGIPVATAVMNEEATAVIALVCQEKAAPWLCAGRDWHTSGSWRSFDLRGPWGTFTNLSIGLIGDHQLENAALALAGLWAMLGSELDESSVRAGLATTTWPGRFEIVKRGDATIVLDGAHTPAAASALAHAFAATFPGQQATIVLGLLNDKDPRAITAALEPIAGRYVAVTPPTPRALPAADLADALAGTGNDVDIASGLDAALHPTASQIVLITGSLTTVAWAREALGLGFPDPSFAS